MGSAPQQPHQPFDEAVDTVAVEAGRECVEMLSGMELAFRNGG